MKQVAILVMLGVIGGNIIVNSEEYNKEHPIVYEALAEAPREVLIETKVEWTEERINQEVEEQAKKYGSLQRTRQISHPKNPEELSN